MTPTPASRFLLPGIAALLFLMVLPELFQAGNGFLIDPATARHLRAGEMMWQKGEILRTDPFGVGQPPRPWIAFEWLFEVGIAGLVRAGGLPLAYAVGFLLFGLIPVALWRFLIRERISLPIAFLYVLGAMLLFRVHLLLRPFLFTYLFMIATVAWWYRYRDKPPRWLWVALPLMFALWANIHGGFAAALLFLILSLVGRVIDRLLARESIADAGLLSWLALAVIAVNATLLTPHGWELHRLIWEMVAHIKSFSQWNEFRPPNFAQLSPLAAAVLLITGVLLISRGMANGRRLKWETLLPLLLFLYFGLKVQRHVLLLVIVAAVPVCRDLDAWFGQHILSRHLRARLGRMVEIERESLSHWWLIPFAAVVAVTVFVNSPRAAGLRVGDRNLTPAAVAYIREHRADFNKPLVTTWNAGALVYHLAPDFRTTFDDRTEFYGDARLTPYIALLRTEPGWEKILREGGYDSAILDHEFSLVDALRRQPGWRKVYEDKLSVIFVRKP